AASALELAARMRGLLCSAMRSASSRVSIFGGSWARTPGTASRKNTTSSGMAILGVSNRARLTGDDAAPVTVSEQIGRGDDEDRQQQRNRHAADDRAR